MCYDSMNARAGLYDTIMRTRLEDELLVLTKKRVSGFELAHMNSAGTQDEEWCWRPVLATLHSNSCRLVLRSVTPQWEDAREEYIAAQYLHKANSVGTYEAVRGGCGLRGGGGLLCLCICCEVCGERVRAHVCICVCVGGIQVTEAKAALDEELSRCPRLEYPLIDSLTSITAPGCDSFPFAGPL